MLDKEPANFSLAGLLYLELHIDKIELVEGCPTYESIDIPLNQIRQFYGDQFRAWDSDDFPLSHDRVTPMQIETRALELISSYLKTLLQLAFNTTISQDKYGEINTRINKLNESIEKFLVLKNNLNSSDQPVQDKVKAYQLLEAFSAFYNAAWQLRLVVGKIQSKESRQYHQEEPSK